MNVMEISISAGEINTACTAALSQFGVNPNICSKVVSSLIKNEALGYSSHGLLRLPEYIEEIRQKTLLPSVLPSTKEISEEGNIRGASFQVDGQRGFGCLAAQAVADALITGLSRSKVATVAMYNCNHIGRLEDIARPVSESGYLLLGFCNYLGAGQKVIPPGGTMARLCTNPVVFAAPMGNKTPIILDMTTSVVAEGKVRAKWQRNEPVPDGWLVDQNNTDVNDPSRLYDNPPSAFLAPLGGADFGYKGFGLALFSEIFAGILTGGGYCTGDEAVGGNGGFFIGLDPSVGGQSGSLVAQHTENLVEYIQSAGVGVRLPGHRERAESIDDEMILTISSAVFDDIVAAGKTKIYFYG